MHTRLAGPSHKASSASDWWGGWATQDSSCQQTCPFANHRSLCILDNVFRQSGSYFHTGIAGFLALLLIQDFILEGIHPSGPELKVAVIRHHNLMFSTQWPVSLGEAQLTQVEEQRRSANQPIKHGRAETGKFSEILIVVSWEFVWVSSNRPKLSE